VSSLTADLEAAARIGGDERGGVTRFAWSPELAQANSWLRDQLAELGLATELDPAGNVIGRWTAGEGKAVALGSHLDTVPAGGRYDGALGVLAALDVVRRLKAEGVEPRRPLWVISFNDEEGGRFQTGMLGSRAFCGDCDLEDWERRGVADAMADAGFDFGRLGEAARVGELGAYLELHIEQGPCWSATASTSASSRRSRECSASGRASPARPTTPARPRWSFAATRSRGRRVWCWRSARWHVAATT
jgi:hydantoinase/carbamoylase family amidase